MLTFVRVMIRLLNYCCIQFFECDSDKDKKMYSLLLYIHYLHIMSKKTKQKNSHQFHCIPHIQQTSVQLTPSCSFNQRVTKIMYAIHSYVTHNVSSAAYPHCQYKYRYITYSADKQIKQVSNFGTKIKHFFLIYPQEQ